MTETIQLAPVNVEEQGLDWISWMTTAWKHKSWDHQVHTDPCAMVVSDNSKRSNTTTKGTQQTLAHKQKWTITEVGMSSGFLSPLFALDNITVWLSEMLSTMCVYCVLCYAGSCSNFDSLS